MCVLGPKDDAWSKGPSTGHDAEGFTTAVLNGRIYLMGGKTGKDAYSNTVKIFDGTTLSDATPMITGRSDAAATIYDKKIYVVGGSTSDSSSGSTNVEVFDGTKWHPAPKMQMAHSLTAAVSFGSKLYIMGA